MDLDRGNYRCPACGTSLNIAARDKAQVVVRVAPGLSAVHYVRYRGKKVHSCRVVRKTA